MAVMHPVTGPDTSLAARALRQLEQWPALTACRTGAVPGKGFAADNRQIIHLHHADEAEVHLTWPVIDRMRETLDASGDIQSEPGDDWIRIRLASEGDIATLMSLVSVAIQASTTHPAKPSAHRTCPAARYRPS